MPAARMAISLGLEMAAAGFFAFLILALPAQSRPVGEFGAFAFILTIVGVQVPLAQYGLHILSYGRALARPRGSKRIVGAALIFTTIASTIIYIVTVCLFFAHSGGMEAAIYACCALRLLGAGGSLLREDATARRAVFEYLPTRLALLSVACLATFSAAIWDAPLFVFALIWGLEGVLFAGAMVFLQRRRRFLLYRRSRLAPIVVKAAPLALQSLFVIIYLRFDQLYVGVRFGDEALGLYAAAARTAELGNLLFQVVSLILTPRIVQELNLFSRLSLRMKAALTSLPLITGLGCIAAFILGGALLGIAFGDAYYEARSVLTVYVAATCFVAYGLIASRILAARGVTGPQGFSGFVGAALNVLLSIWFGELFGLEGVALATVVSYAVAAGLLWWAVRESGAAREAPSSSSSRRI